MIKFIKREYTDEKIFLFIDEFQYIQEAGLYLKVLFDALKTKLHIVVSGSSILEITKNKEYLTGRKIEFIVYPLSFREFAKFRLNYTIQSGISFSDSGELKDFYSMYGEELNLTLIEYLNWVGFPEIVQKTEEKKSLILGEILTTYIQRDIAGFLKIENIEAFNNLLRLLSSQIGNLVNYSELSTTLQINQKTLKKYINILRESLFYFLYHLILKI